MTTPLTPKDIESVIEELPLQSRTMIRLLLLQYLDLTQEDIEFMALDQPDSRFLSGGQPEKKKSDLEGTRVITARMNQYREFFRHKRERPWLQVQGMEGQIANIESRIAVTERMLTSQFSVKKTVLEECKKTAKTALPRPAIRQLEKAWDNEEVSEEDYRKQRLLIEYQTLYRQLIRHKRRLLTTKQELEFSSNAPLRDHEIAHIWEIPLGTLAGRKVKALHLYLTKLQSTLQESNGSSSSETPSPQTQPRDLWKETLTTLGKKTVERSIVSYGGLEKTEERLMEKLREFASGDLPEEAESKFWMDISRIKDTEHTGPWENYDRSIFALQRLQAIQNDLDLSPEEIAEKLTVISTPKSLLEALPAHEEEEDLSLSERGLGVLQAFVGEQDDKRRT